MFCCGTAPAVDSMFWTGLCRVVPCNVLLQEKQAELEQLQCGLTADAASLSQQLSTFEARREEAIRELQVSVCVWVCVNGCVCWVCACTHFT